MTPVTRRQWLATASAAAFSAPWQTSGEARAGDLPTGGPRIATFRCDVTPPPGHSLCGGWIKPVEAVDDPLEAIGVVLLGCGAPVVLCAVDWTGILNGAHRAWREAIARAVQTDPQRVAVHCVHQHNAPFACVDAQAIVARYPELPAIVDIPFFEATVAAVAQAAAEALAHAQPLTHAAVSQAQVDKVAGNRRMLGPDGRVASMRGSSSTLPEHHAAPEGLIDPWLKTVAFYNGDQKVAACHYYACHPMSYYGDGRVSADFCGLARKRRQADEPDCTHVYFNGCGGNIAAGKYNDGSAAMRDVLTQRVYAALAASETGLRPAPIEAWSWRTADVSLTPDPRWDADGLAEMIADARRPVVDRNRPSYTLAYLRRMARSEPITLGALEFNDVCILHLPSECFIEYQLAAQKAAPGRFVACAAYGDGGPWYIPNREAYPQGGYEVSVAWCGPGVEDELWNGVSRLLASG